ncbi:unnamed protein product [Caenorhabditis nigoni]
MEQSHRYNSKNPETKLLSIFGCVALDLCGSHTGTVSLEWKSARRAVSVDEYFFIKYGITLLCPDAPLVSSLFPQEVVRVIIN